MATLERVLPARTGEFAVLTYHRVADPALSPLCYPGLFTNPSEFAAQMTFLASRYRPVSLTELLGARRGEHALPLRSVLITFDDGYRDFSDHAWPILRRQGIPTVLFRSHRLSGEPRRASGGTGSTAQSAGRARPGRSTPRSESFAWCRRPTAWTRIGGFGTR